MRVSVLALCVISYFLAPPMVVADEFRPALLEIAETEQGWYSVMWKVPLQNGRPLTISPKLPDRFEQMGPASTRIFQDSAIEESTWSLESGSIVGGTIEIDGLSAIAIDVIVQIDLADGTEHSAILRAASPSYIIPDRATKWMVAGSYWRIGTIHILEGYDHLLFVLALMLIVPNLWMLFKTITAFTVAHSISLALATFGVVNMPLAPTEAVIALSILFLAVEIVHSRDGRMVVTARYPWVVALAFGLVHGLGFAGALAEVGLPQQEIPLALLMFNVGVELGQLLFIAAILVLLVGLRKARSEWPAWAYPAAAYGIGGIAAFWFVDRVAGF